MFIIWYSLFSTLYLFITILYFFFCKILKLNSIIFDTIFKKIDNFFNFYYLINNSSIKLNSLQVDNFKILYSENLYFSNKNIPYFTNKNGFNNSLLFCNINNTLSNKLNYSFNLNFIIYIFMVKYSNVKSNIKKLNLNYFFNKLLISNILPSENYGKNLVKNNAYVFIKKKINTFKNSSVTVLSSLNNNSWIIKFSPSNFIKYINSLNLNIYNILYLRKNKVFNKGRYSRNRQYYRTGVYWCLYVNIIAVVGIYFWFYRFTMNFGYLWWLLFAFILSFIAPKAIKYKLYNPITLFTSIIESLLWFGTLFYNMLTFNSTVLEKIVLNIKHFYLNLKYFSTTKNIFKNLPSIYLLILNLANFSKKSKNQIYVWEFNNTNYYYNSVIQSRPIIFEKLRQFFLRLVSIIFLK